MKISAVNLNRQEINKKKINSVQTSANLQKEYGAHAIELTGNYNLAFCGLFSKDEQVSYDVTRLAFEHKMHSNLPYLISDDSRFLLNGFMIDLQRTKEKNLIQNLKPGESLVFGREGISLPGMNDGVSRKHLKIEKSKNNKLIATDMGSLNGTIILPNIQVPNPKAGSFKLQPQTRYVLPPNSVFNVGGYVLNLATQAHKISDLPDKDYINYSVFNEIPLRIEKYGKDIIAQNLSESIDTKFLYLDGSIFQNDYSNISEASLLPKNVPTLIPQNSQLRLGKEFTIDTRDKKINALLDQKGKIVIGRHPDCDYVVNGFNNQVSNKHLSLQKTSLGIVATDLGSRNGTIVIPQERIKVFYNDINGLALQQGNIGDCTLLSALYSLSLNPRGKELIKNMVSIDDNGSYIVKFPNSQPIKVEIEDLYGQQNNKGEKKKAVESELGIKAIERAYARYINQFGRTEHTMFGVIDDGALLQTPLYNLTNIMPQTTKVDRNNIDDLFSNIVYSGSCDRHVITCSTPQKGKFGKYVDSQGRFISKHAYSIRNINLNDRCVEIVNPHNTKYSHILSFEEFTKYFYEVCDLKY